MQTVHAFPLEGKGVRTGPRSCHVLVQFILEQENTTSTVNVDVKEAMAKSLSLHDTLQATEWI